MSVVNITSALNNITFDGYRLAAVDNSLYDSNGILIPLRHQATLVLRTLVEHHDTIVPKQQFFDDIWAGVFVTDDSLVQCISDIRKRIGDKDRRIVESVPRRGYRLNSDSQSFIPMTYQSYFKMGSNFRNF